MHEPTTPYHTTQSGSTAFKTDGTTDGLKSTDDNHPSTSVSSNTDRHDPTESSSNPSTSDNKPDASDQIDASNSQDASNLVTFVAIGSSVFIVMIVVLTIACVAVIISCLKFRK